MLKGMDPEDRASKKLKKRINLVEAATKLSGTKHLKDIATDDLCGYLQLLEEAKEGIPEAVQWKILIVHALRLLEDPFPKPPVETGKGGAVDKKTKNRLAQPAEPAAAPAVSAKKLAERAQTSAKCFVDMRCLWTVDLEVVPATSFEPFSPSWAAALHQAWCGAGDEEMQWKARLQVMPYRP